MSSNNTNNNNNKIESKQYTFMNWGRCWGKSNPKQHLYPTSIGQVQSIVLQSLKEKSDAMAKNPYSSSSLENATQHNIRAVGCGYSPNDICFTSGTMIHPDKMKNISVMKNLNNNNNSSSYIKCDAGVLLSEASNELDKYDLVLPTAVSIVDITLVGAAAVGAHGTGAKFSSFSEHVAEIEGVNGLGEIVRASEITGENAHLLPALRCHLGLLLVVTSITMKVFPKKLYTISSRPTTLNDILENLDEKVDSHDFYKFIWVPNTNHVYETFSGEIPAPSPSYSTTLKVNELPQVVCSSKNNRSINRYISELAFYWAYDNLARLDKVHRLLIKMNLSTTIDNSVETALKKNPKSSSIEVTAGSVMHFNALDVGYQHATTEWAIPRKFAIDAIKNWTQIVKEENLITHLLLEVRFTKADDPNRVLISPTSGRDTAFLGIVIFRPFDLDSKTIKKVFMRFQKLMLVYQGRSHWCKPYQLSHDDMRSLYSNPLDGSKNNWDDFEQVRRKMDPHKIFENDWSKRHEIPTLKSLL